MQENKSPDRQYIENLQNLNREIGGSPDEIKQLAVHLLSKIVSLTSKDAALTITQSETGIKLHVFEAGTNYFLEYPFPASRSRPYTVIPRENIPDCKTAWSQELTAQIEAAARRIPENISSEDFFRIAKIDPSKKQTP